MSNKLVEWGYKFAGTVLTDEEAREAFECLVKDVDVLTRAAVKNLTTARVLGLSAAVSQALLELASGVRHGKG
jgi:hypothetical protein